MKSVKTCFSFFLNPRKGKRKKQEGYLVYLVGEEHKAMLHDIYSKAS